MRLPEVAAPAAAAEPAGPSPEIVDLTQRMRRWRGLTVMTGALAASIVAIVAAREYRPDVLPADWRPKPQVVEKVVEKPVEVVREVVRDVPAARPAQYVAVFQKDEQSPSFVMSVDLEKRTVTVRQVAAERFPDKAYQLWIATAPGATPQSLGVLGGEFRVDQQQRVGLRALVGIERAERVFRRHAFAVFVHRHDPRHSRISSRLRRSQVLIVFAGASNFAANWSRLQPL
jgi:hypothetical protein